MTRHHDWQGMHWIRDSTRYAIYWRDRDPVTNKFRCLWCNEKTKKLCLDHLLPVNLGGGNEPANLISSCLICNVQRRAQDWQDWTDSGNFDLAVYRRIMSCLSRKLTRSDRETGKALWLARDAKRRSRSR